MSIGTKTFLVAALVAIVAFSGSLGGASDAAFDRAAATATGHAIH